MKVSDVIMEAIDDNLIDALCTGCEWRNYFSATRYCPEEWICPAEFDTSSETCGKHQQYLRIRELAVVIEEALKEEK